MIPYLLVSAIPFVADTPSGVASVELSRNVRLEVISADTVYGGMGFSFDYEVQGLRLVSDSGADTLAWIADLPATALAAVRGSGASLVRERRTLAILACTPSYVGGVIGVDSSRDGRSTSRYRAYRTWLMGGIPLDLDAVVQRDSLFDAVLRLSLGVPMGRNLDSWLWRRGYWLDPQSFLILPGTGGEMTLRIGLPSWQGVDSLLVVDLDLEHLHTAAAAMLD
jgi:hypothetical protein